MTRSSQHLTLLLTDIEGSTGLWEQHPSAMRELLPAHDQIIAEAVRAAGGTLVKSKGEGDSSFSVFADALAALNCAIEIQRRLAELPDGPVELRVRAAIHAGGVEARDDDFFGPTVNRCARIRAAAHGGQILVSEAVTHRVDGTLPDGTSLLDLGAHRFRDLAEPMHVYQVLHPDLIEGLPPLRTLEAIEHNLILPPDELIGRALEVGRIREQLERSRALTLVGPGGVGKTRVAVAAAFGSLERFRSTWFVDLSPAVSAPDVAEAVARTLGIKPGGTDTLDTIAAHLGSERVLLVMDNCEQVLDGAAATVTGITRRCPATHVLATSRAPLPVPGGSVIAIEPLAVPAGGDATAIAASPAVRLFVERAAAARPGFMLDDRNANEVARLVESLDGLPLAIELAAARADTVPIARLGEVIGGEPPADGGHRHHSIRTTLDWSYGLLDEAERTLYRSLAEFSAPFTAEAARAVGATDAPVTSSLADLATHAFLVIDERAGQLRYRMLETIRAHAAEVAHDVDEAAEVRRRYIAYFSDLVRDPRDDHGGPGAPAWFEALDADYDNVVAALRLAIDDGMAPDEGLSIAASLRVYWETRGLLEAAIGWLKRGLEAAPDAPRREVARAMRALGLILRLTDRVQQARELFERALQMSRDDGDASGVHHSLAGLAHVLSRLGDHRAAIRLYDEVLDRETSEGNRHGMATALGNIGIEARLVGDLERARSATQQSIEIFAAMGDRRGEVVSVHGLASVLEAEGDLAEAETTYERALAGARELTYRPLEAAALCNLGRVRATHDLAGARPLFEESIAISRTIAFEENIINVLSAYGRAETRWGDVDQGRSLLIESLARAAAASGDGLSASAQVLRTLAQLELERGDARLAATLLGRAHAIDPEPEHDAFDDGFDLKAAVIAVLGSDYQDAVAAWDGFTLPEIARALQDRLVEPIAR